MTFKEIDERICHYEDELDWCANALPALTNLIEGEESNRQILYLESQKMKLEFCCFVTTSYIDLLCTYRNLKRSKTKWEKFYNIKMAYLIAYETINTYYKYKAEIFRTVTKEDKEIYKGFFDMLNRELAEFKEKYDYNSIMPKIRNKSTAHYDKNFLEYYASFKLIDNIESKEIVRSFLNFINPLHYFAVGLLKGKIDKFLFINSWLS